jgi:hypothetical protein
LRVAITFPILLGVLRRRQSLSIERRLRVRWWQPTRRAYSKPRPDILLMRSLELKRLRRRTSGGAEDTARYCPMRDAARLGCNRICNSLEFEATGLCRTRLSVRDFRAESIRSGARRGSLLRQTPHRVRSGANLSTTWSAGAYLIEVISQSVNQGGAHPR